MKLPLPVIFALLTGFFWGTYGAALAKSRIGFAGNPFRPYLMIGIAYLIWGIVGGLVGMASTQIKGESFFHNFKTDGITWGFIAGTLGAWGALTLTLAMFTGGGAMPQIVMPIVFGTAVTVSAIVAVMTTKGETNPMLYVGIVGMAICIVVVAYFTPHPHPPAKPAMPAPAESKA